MHKYFALILLLTFATAMKAGTVPNCDQICGKWYSPEESLVIQVYKDGEDFRAKVVSFKCGAGETPETCLDTKNPDPALRNRKLIGMNVLSGLKYDADNKTWDGGMIYDSHNGRDWNASAYIDEDGSLKVKGYWHVKFIGRTMTFNRVSELASK